MTATWKAYPKSKEMYEDALGYFAMGVGSQVQSFSQPHPIYMSHGKGSRLWDVDGNEYIDYLLNYGPNILGHSPEVLDQAIKRQVDLGCGFGEPHQGQLSVSKKLIDAVPCYEMVNFNNTGAESVQAVVRLARTFTGKTKIIKFEGHYHGWMDNLFVSFHPTPEDDLGTRDDPKTVMHGYTKGQPKSVLEEVIALPWNYLDVVEKTLKREKGNVAAIITEPIMSNCGVIMPAPGYLEGLKRLCEQYDCLLIFDEVITGCRVALGGAQETSGLTPDISLGAKALGGGFGVMAYGARREIMQIVADRLAVHAGTFNGNPIATAAADCVLDELARDDQAVLKRINLMGETLKEEIGKSAKRHGIAFPSAKATSATCENPLHRRTTITPLSGGSCWIAASISSRPKKVSGIPPRRTATRRSSRLCVRWTKCLPS